MDGMGIHIGDVGVHRGEPPEGNPYKAGSLMGDERATALYAWRDGKPTEARRLTDSREVDWNR